MTYSEDYGRSRCEPVGNIDVHRKSRRVVSKVGDGLERCSRSPRSEDGQSGQASTKGSRKEHVR